MEQTKQNEMTVEVINLMASEGISLKDAKLIAARLMDVLVEMEGTVKVEPIKEIAPETVRVRGAKR